MRQDPILLTGVYRSGTTLLSCMLGAHPDLNFTYGSVNYLRWFVKKGISPDKYREIVLQTKNRLYKRYKKDINEKSILSAIEKFDGDISHAQIYSSIMEEFFQDKTKRWGEKTLLEWSSIPKFIDLYSSSQAIHIVRDPRDVVASFKGMTFEPRKRYLDSIFACMHSMDASFQFKKDLPQDRYYVVLYESLIENSEDELKKICDFLGVEYSESMMNKDMYKDQFGDLLNIKSHTSYGDTSKKPIGRWKEKLRASDIAFTEGLLAKQMQKFDYSVSSEMGELIKEFLSTFQKEDLLQERLIKYLETLEGCEEYPSDPTKEENWTVLGERDKGASSLYLKNDNKSKI